MGFPLTHEMLIATYELLRQTPPFRGWKLPPADEVSFHVLRTKDRCGDHVYENEHIIRISYAKHRTLRTLTETMAHEMCHMREFELGARADVAHGAAFKKLAKVVCRYHNFDEGAF